VSPRECSRFQRLTAYVRSLRNTVALVALAGLVAAVPVAPDTRAFSVSIHEGITVSGLSPPGQNVGFLREAVLDDIKDQHEQLDRKRTGSIARDERHFDDSEFDGGAEYIRDRYEDAEEELVDGDVWDATDEFGSALHPAMDIYAHSNWV
jgi:hypothetical protein